MLLTNVEARGVVRYLHALVAFDKATRDVCYVVTSEKCNMPNVEHEASFICAFPGEGHINFGLSTEWTDLDKFESRAKEIVINALGCPDPES